MHIVATAGHVDHGKSALVEALTGTHPDRLAEERRRGLTLDLGFAWTDPAAGGPIAFVDVPGHQRFVPTMLAGVGPAPAALLVVAADEGMRAQSYEHLRALHALRVAHGLLVVTKTDLADAGPALAGARAALAGTSLAGVPAVPVSARTGAGLPELRAALDRLAAGLPAPDPAADVRLWLDRAFTIAGAGTVVTGTLSGGTLRVGDALLLGDVPVRVRGLQALGAARESVAAAARVAVNLRGVPRAAARRGLALLTPGAWLTADTVDVRLDPAPDDTRPGRTARGGGRERIGRDGMLHVGSAAVPVHARALAPDLARLRLARPLPLRVGDRALWRDPGSHAIVGVVVLDVRPPPLDRRHRPADRAAALAGGVPDGAALLAAHGLRRGAELRAMGVTPPGTPAAGDWYADPAHWAALRGRLAAAVAAYAAGNPLHPAMPVEAAAAALGVAPEVAGALVAPPLVRRGGRIAAGDAGLPEPVRAAVAALLAGLADAPFAAPAADRLAALGLGGRELAAAARAGLLLRLPGGVVLGPAAPAAAAARLAELPQPFTASAARLAWGTSRRVAIPLLEHLDATGRTIRVDDAHRRLSDRPPADGA
ncbi:selenocysteine-specific translation elongation factor [Pilimelia anulata]|uniref:Selenocysteine-specific translation elongation factor n=1 Tax=Pilimelia anulata TaxID=53371 RepID=A0A8J3B5M8_9ACTN|nr:selenocysteine-specific translation elongation factor [Pilimelia anulata]GGJ95421.1 selenocysteine-specific translation elongation factor [Pilimelia anulata]